MLGVGAAVVYTVAHYVALNLGASGLVPASASVFITGIAVLIEEAVGGVAQASGKFK